MRIKVWFLVFFNNFLNWKKLKKQINKKEALFKKSFKIKRITKWFLWSKGKNNLKIFDILNLMLRREKEDKKMWKELRKKK